MTEESLPLDGVHEDDRVNVGNVITVIKALRKCVSWAVTPSGGAYEVMAMLDSKREAELAVTLQDMELIQQVDPLRVTHVGVQVSSPDSTFLTRIRVPSRDILVFIEGPPMCVCAGLQPLLPASQGPRPLPARHARGAGHRAHPQAAQVVFVKIKNKS